MALKDTKLEEKEQLVVKGSILADEFRDRKTGFDLPKRYYAHNIKALDNELLEKLLPGDSVVKITESSGHRLLHNYIVSYKEHHVGICLTYTDAAGVETQSYDYTDGQWVYNSQDKWQAD